jgi:hypothetical protein
MPSWTHLVRFVAVEDSQEHLGQLVDTTRDVGLDSAEGKEIAVYLIDGTIFDGKVTKEILHVKQVCHLFSDFTYSMSQMANFAAASLPSFPGSMQLHSMLGTELHGSRTGNLTSSRNAHFTHTDFTIGSKPTHPQSSNPLHKAPNSPHRSLSRRNQRPEMRARRYKRL